MAERRMFAKTIIDSDAFIDMPVTARLLYYDLAMRADDDGFINSPKKIMRMIGASQDDLSILILRKFIIPFDNGVVVIKHWRIHNYIRKDMYHETKYKEEKNMLSLDENNAYTMSVTKYETDSLQGCNDVVSIPYTQVRLGKDRLGKDSIEREKRTAFTPPTIDEVTAYCRERNNKIDPAHFIDFYASKGWMVGKNKMKDWKAAIRTWEQRDKETKPSKGLDYGQRAYSDDEISAIERRKLGIT